MSSMLLMRTIVLVCALALASRVTAQELSALYFDTPEVALSPTELKSLGLADDWIGSASYPYRAGDAVVFPFGVGPASVVCAPLRVCLVELERGERIVDVGAHAGDVVRWGLQTTLGANDTTFVVLKPLEAGLETSLALITNRRAYYINLKSQRERYIPKIRFDYPEHALAALAQERQRAHVSDSLATLPSTGLKIDDLDFNYTHSSCKGCGRWAPTRVYNTGKQTIIEFPQVITQMDAPVLLVTDQTGTEAVVNFRMIGNRYVVDNLFQSAVLVLGVGKKQQRITIRRGKGS